MFWLVALVGVGIMIAAISKASKRSEEAQKRDEFNTLAQSRIGAYGDFLKRTGGSEKITAMTENEVRDFLQQNIREYAKDREGLAVMVALIVAAGLVVGMALAFAQSSFGPLVVAVVGMIALIGTVYTRTNKKLERKYAARGLDVAKLKIEA